MKTTKHNYWLGKKVAVAGSSGFLGSHFVAVLKKSGAKVKSISKSKFNLLNLKSTSRALKGVDVVINCAALDGNLEYKLHNSAKIMDRNIKITSNILNASIKNGIKDLVIISSVEIYSPLAPSPIKELDDYQKYNNHTQNGYILSKRYGEILSTLFAKESGLRIYIPRPTNIYGPNDRFDETSSRVIPSFIKNLSTNKTIEIWGDGSQTKQFIYVIDAVKVILKMVEKRFTGPLNVAPVEAISLLDLAKIIYKKLESSSEILLKPSRGTGANNRVLDTSEMDRLIDFPLTDLQIGLQNTIDWYKNCNGKKVA